MSSYLLDITLALARRTRRIIWTNFAGTIVVDAVGVGLAAFGFLNPLFAAFIHVASEMAFILNSARLLPAGAKDDDEGVIVASRAGATVPGGFTNVTAAIVRK